MVGAVSCVIVCVVGAGVSVIVVAVAVAVVVAVAVAAVVAVANGALWPITAPLPKTVGLETVPIQQPPTLLICIF